MENQQVTKLIEKAANAQRADDAMKFAQAAVNAANALACLSNTKKV